MPEIQPVVAFPLKEDIEIIWGEVEKPTSGFSREKHHVICSQTLENWYKTIGLNFN